MRTSDTGAVVTAPELPAPPEPPRGSTYAALLRQIKQAGLLDRRTGYYAWMIALSVILLTTGWTAFVLIGQSWWQLAVAVLLAAVSAQVGFLAHDAGHRQIFSTRRANDLVGIVLANLAVGLSYRFWLDKHNRHHAHPNQKGKDPDIDFAALAFTSQQAGGRGRLARIMYRYQAYFFFPLLALTAFGLHVDSAVYLTRRNRTAPHLGASALRDSHHRLLRCGVLGALASQGRGLRRAPTRAARSVPGRLVRPQSQRHADPRSRPCE